MNAVARNLNKGSYNMPRYGLVLLCVFTSLQANLVLAQGDETNQFQRRLLSPVEITKSIVLPPRSHGNLSAKDRNDLLDAKQTLVDFLKSFSKRNQNPLEYLLPSIKDKYKDRFDLFRKEFPDAEAIMKLAVGDFAIKRNKNEIVFYTDLTTALEGEFNIRQSAFALKKTSNGWKLSRFNQDIASREAEENSTTP